jgi:hypothetical protein
VRWAQMLTDETITLMQLKKTRAATRTLRHLVDRVATLTQRQF